MKIKIVILAILASLLASSLASDLADSADCVLVRDFKRDKCEVCNVTLNPCRHYVPKGCHKCPPATSTTTSTPTKMDSKFNISSGQFDFEVQIGNTTAGKNVIELNVSNHFSLVNVLAGSGLTVFVLISILVVYLKKDKIVKCCRRGMKKVKKVYYQKRFYSK